MKYVLSIAILLSGWGVGAAELSLREHMQAMGYLLDAIWVDSADVKTYPQAADKTAELRDHLTKVISLVPGKIQGMQIKQKRAALIDFHQLVARTIYLSATLEQTLSQPDLDPVSGSRERDVQNLLKEISVVVGRGHGRYRDK